MKLSFDNLNKPSNKKLKKWVDLALYLLPLYLSALMTTPLSETFKLWATFVTTVITVTIKGLTKFTAEEDLTNEENN